MIDKKILVNAPDYVKDFNLKHILLNTSEYANMFDKKTIKVKNYKNEIIKIPRYLIIRLFFDDNYYEYLKNILNDDNRNLKIGQFNRNTILLVKSFSRLELVVAINKFIKNNNIRLDKKYKKRLETINRSIKFSTFIKNYSNKIYHFNIDNKSIY